LRLRLSRHEADAAAPIVQRRLADRLRKAGGKGVLDLKLRTGKRGEFSIVTIEWFV
jgi:hypothetical protein